MGTAFLTHGCQLAVNGKYIRHAQTQTNHQSLIITAMYSDVKPTYLNPQTNHQLSEWQD